MTIHLTQSSRIKSTPFTSRNNLNGASSYTVYNKMLLPTIFKDLESDYFHLMKNVQLWDVCAQKIIQFDGPDALNFLKFVSARDFQKIANHKCYYTPMTNNYGGLLNDTLVYFFNNQKIWVSISDSDMLLWFLGLIINSKFDLNISEKEIYTLALQGPKSNLLAEEIFGEKINSLKFYNFDFYNFSSEDIVISKTGYSKQGGYEFLISDADVGRDLWDLILKKGLIYDVRVGCPNLIERVESSLLSYGNDMTSKDTPYDCSLGKYCSVEVPYNFIGKTALSNYTKNERKKGIYHVFFAKEAIRDNKNLNCYFEDRVIGQLTSAIYSPKFQTNLAFMIAYEDDVLNENRDYLVKTKKDFVEAKIKRIN